jgi:hypothetical protein
VFPTCKLHVDTYEVSYMPRMELDATSKKSKTKFQLHPTPGSQEKSQVAMSSFSVRLG